MNKENISLHNALLRGLIKNVCLSNTPPLIKNGLEENVVFQKSLGFDYFPKSPREGRTQRRFNKDCNGSKARVKSLRLFLLVLNNYGQWMMVKKLTS